LKTRFATLLTVATAVLALSPSALASSTNATGRGPQPTSYPYTFTNNNGTTTVIPSQPKRIACIGVPFNICESLLVLVPTRLVAMSSEPAANSLACEDSRDFPCWDHVPAGVQPLGFPSVGTNYSELASLNPDLIIVDPSFAATQNLTLLQSIAPVIEPVQLPNNYLADQTLSWLYHLGPALDATTNEANYSKTFHALAKFVKTRLQGKTFDYVQLQEGGEFDQTTSDHPSTYEFIKYLGLQPAPLIPGGTAQSGTVGGVPVTISSLLSDEVLPQLQGYYLFVASYIATPDELDALVKSNPLWQDIPAVKAKRVVWIPDRGTWFGAICNLDLLKALASHIKNHS
jgi:ABC-type Fe3+-hydroxamate transport system substrate-binding protein